MVWISTGNTQVYVLYARLFKALPDRLQATDIDGTPPGLPSDGPNYLKFLTTMRSKLPDGKTLSIAAPASYWYLKAFPISKMAKQLDYIVFMTYDLHGACHCG